MSRRYWPLVAICLFCFGCDTKSSDPSTTADNATPGSSTSESSTSRSKATSPTDDTQIGDNASVNATKQLAEWVSFPTGGVELLRPQDFEIADRFHGFQQPSTNSVVMIVLIPGPITEVAAGFTADNLKSRGMTLQSKEDVAIDGTTGVLLGITQDAFGIRFAKWIATVGNDKETRLITATYPKDDANLSRQLKEVILSARIIAVPALGKVPDVGFAIVGNDKLKFAFESSKALVYNKDGIVPSKSTGSPVFVVARSYSVISVVDKREFAVRRLHKTEELASISVTSNNEVSIDGLDGFELIANAHDKKSGSPQVTYQVILFDDESYFIMQGVVGVQFEAEYLPEFKALAHSFTRTRK